ncbi:putative dipeptidase [Iodidimonas gelatinilytica]|uniref:Putative dipeptidase n=1 Tax=Iodidimonas gelatinilytica TaxID=1236966 RepID=A0A5A7MSK8_9PROT|nr:membrane dipeptidase [Iodidimonas gelatinilytica]GEQ98870.1 putative dipeptidase [Iodidimonas gelatinilytica]
MSRFLVNRRHMLGGMGVLASAGLMGALGPRWVQAQIQNQTQDQAQDVFSAEAREDFSKIMSAEQRAEGRRFLKNHPSIDTHAHPGRFFLDGIDVQNPAVKALGPANVSGVVDDIKTGNVTAAVFSCVADLPLLSVGPQGIRAARDFRPGEAYGEYRRQIGILHAICERGLLSCERTAQGVEAAHRGEKSVCLFGVEGGDFIEDAPERVFAAAKDGVRTIGLVHYHVNQLGDNQTETPVHNGLTDLGRIAVKAMNEAGILIDLAHASEAASRDCLEVSSRPVMLSHTSLQTENVRHPRMITPDHARLVAQHGGAIGVAPWGLGQQNLSDYIDAILAMIEVVGADHVMIGTDMDATYKPVFDNYADWDVLPAALLARGVPRLDVAKVMGGNFLRLLAQVEI